VRPWSFLSGASVSFAHLEHDKIVLKWQGSQIPLICCDELTHFSAKQFWYMVSLNRYMSGVRPYTRTTCNPDADSWVAELISWWIDQDTGLPIPERADVLRWFVRIGDAIIWGDSHIKDEGERPFLPEARAYQAPCPAHIRGGNRRQSVGERLPLTVLMCAPGSAEASPSRPCPVRQILKASVGPTMPISGPPSAIRANAEHLRWL